MQYACNILADSVNSQGVRLTTFLLSYPRIVLAEFNTHRMFSRNTSSSRAIPVAKQIKRIRDDPFTPRAFGQNTKGMQAHNDLDSAIQKRARQVWHMGLESALEAASELEQLEVHKQLANRVIEPYSWVTQVVTATDWANFFSLRCSADAQPEIQHIALMMRDLYYTSYPEPSSIYQKWRWHLPFIHDDEIDNSGESIEFWKKVSVGRCARTSYLNHDGKRDPQADADLADKLWLNGHLSPFEHVARPFKSEEYDVISSMQTGLEEPFSQFARDCMSRLEYVGNLRGWVSLRSERETN